MNDQPRSTSRWRRLLRHGALLPVALTFGLTLWGELQARTWLNLPASGRGSAEASAVAGAAAERSPDWQLAQQAGRTPEIIAVPLFMATDATVAARAAGQPVGARDLVASYPDSSWGYGGLAQIWRAQTITVIDGKRARSYATWQPTVGDFLSEQQIELGEQDQISPELTASVQTIDSKTPVEITITRVQETKVVIKESIPITIKYKDDPTAEKGTERTVEVGQAGVKALTYLVRREDGVEVKRTLLDTAVPTAMKPKVIARGTKVRSYGTGTATWYTCSLSHVAASNGIAKGTKIRVVSLATGQATVVTVVGTGGNGMSALVDLSCDAFKELTGGLGAGRISVRVEKYYE